MYRMFIKALGLMIIYEIGYKNVNVNLLIIGK